MTEHEVEGIVVIHLEGEMKNALSDQLKRRFREHLDEGRVRIVVDMAGLEFIHSYGIAVLVAATKRARREGGDIVFCALSAPVAELFHMVRLEKVFRLFDGQDEALRAF